MCLDTGAPTTVYAEGGDPVKQENPDSEDTESQFFIKWKGWSHLHNTWESKNTLVNQRCGGMKKLENYIKRMEEVESW